MTTVVLTAIGILLAAVAGLAIIFYGNSSSEEAVAAADGVSLMNQATQIEASISLYTAEKGAKPGEQSGEGVIDDLIDAKYLEAFPATTSSAGNWVIDYSSGTAQMALGSESDKRAELICKKVRSQSGLTGEPKSCSDPSLERNDPCCIAAS